MHAHKAIFAVAVVMLGSLVGCSSGGQSSLDLVSQKSGERFHHAPPVGVADVNDAGETDVVITSQCQGQTPDCPPVKHVMHVRVLWKQGHAIKSQNVLASTNAVIQWYVMPAGSDSGRESGLIEYRGAGLVQVDRDGDDVTIKIDRATLNAASVSGARMADRLGTVNLSGTFHARQNRQETAVALGEVRGMLAAARSVGGEASISVDR